MILFSYVYFGIKVLGRVFKYDFIKFEGVL